MTDKVYELKKALKEFAMVGIQEDLILFDGLTVYNEITGEEEQFKSIEAIVEKYPDMVIELFDSYEGGRGQKSKEVEQESHFQPLHSTIKDVTLILKRL